MHKLGRFLGAVAAMGCGGNAIVTPVEIKTRATASAQGLQGAGFATQSAIAFQNLSYQMVNAMQSSNGAGLDLSALPAPAKLWSGAFALTAPPPLAALARNAPTAATAATPSGCIRQTVSGPTVFWTGQGGCTVAGHIEVSYLNGDKMNVVMTYLGNNVFNRTVTVLTGNWMGVSLTYAGTFTSQFTPGTSNARITGPIRYRSAANTIVLDADLEVTHQLAVTQSSSTTRTVADTLSGTVNDRVGGIHSTLDWTSTVNITTAATTTVSSNLTGDAQTDVVDGGVVTGSLKWSALSLHAEAPQGSSVSRTAGGEVASGGTNAGSLRAKDPQHVIISWKDGTETAFDTTGLLPEL